MDMGEQCFNTGQQKNIPSCLESCLLGQKKPIMLYLYLYARHSARNYSFCQLLSQST